MRIGVAPPAKFWHPNHLGNLRIPTAHLPWGHTKKTLYKKYNRKEIVVIEDVA
jgi:hypothetical protein